MYELYIVTAGSQVYAETIANQVLDPKGEYFNRDVNRIKGMKEWNSEVNQWVDCRAKIVSKRFGRRGVSDDSGGR